MARDTAVFLARIAEEDGARIAHTDQFSICMLQEMQVQFGERRVTEITRLRARW